MIAEGRTALPVEDESGASIGIIDVEDILAASKA
jgi:CBS domain-containing protein